jgi:hypothetical protein
VTKEIKLVPVTEVEGKRVPAAAAANPNVPLLVLMVFVQVVFVTMVYGPIAAYLVEAFPAKIRYTSLSLPYHIGQRRVWGPAASDRAIALRGNAEYLCGTSLSDRSGAGDVCGGNNCAGGDAAYSDLARGAS